jgi:ribosomal protein S18 acetylase RimI-like enzyme
VNIVRLNPAQIGEVSAFIAHLQADKTHQCAYFGEDAAEIAAAIQTFVPPNNGLLAYEHDRLVGFLGVDTDEESSRAWLYGPLVDHPDWQTTADALYAKIFVQGIMPTFVCDEELFVDATNVNTAAFAERHQFIPGVPHVSLRLDRQQAARLPVAENITVLSEAYHAPFERLHDVIFPGAYFSGQQIIERLGERDQVFIALHNVDVVGYLYARIEPEATHGYIDFLGVGEAFRRQGLGKKLLAAASHWLFAFPEIEAVTLTVNTRNASALELYTNLGFTHVQTLHAYRKQY